MEKIEKLPWDSDFLGLRVGRIRLDGNQPIVLKDSGFDLIYIFSDKKLGLAAVKNLNYEPVDRKITFYFDLTYYKTSTYPNGISSYHAGNMEDDESVIRLGIQSGVYSRFKSDEKFKPGTFERLYTIWMRRSIDREIADEVFIYSSGSSEPEGVITVKLKPEVAEIGIVAVDEKHRGKKIGDSLINAALVFATKHNCKYVEVATQADNIPACKFYEKLGFKIKKTEHIYHYWN